MTARLRRAAQRVIEEVRVEAAWSKVAPAVIRAVDDLAAAMPRTKRRPPKPSKVERTAKIEAKREHTETVKAQVFKRDGCCVLCEGPIHDMHHMLFGSGNRIPNERVDTCASCCRAHHDLAHDGDVHTLVRLAAWAWGLGYAQAATATERRIAKIRRVQERVRRLA